MPPPDGFPPAPDAYPPPPPYGQDPTTSFGVPADATQQYQAPQAGWDQPPGGYPPGGYPPEGGYYAEGPPPEEPKKGKTALWVALALLLIAGIVAAGFVFLGGDDEEPVASGDDDTTILLEPASFRLANAFSDSIEDDDADLVTDPPRDDLPPLGELVAARGGRPVSGDEVGLYGGTRDAALCDPDQLVEFLEDDEEKAQAWADVVGIDPSEIADYVATLTPVTLRVDTYVLNHGYEDGEATPIPSILQAGTAVLVDEFGVPRVKCNCGNPLAEAPEIEGDADIDDSDAWDGFDAEEVAVLDASEDAINEFVLVDSETGDLFIRPAGSGGDDDKDPREDVCEDFPDEPGCEEEDPDDTTTTDPDDTSTTDPDDTSSTTEPVLGTGDVQITLRWSTAADLDLSVTDPLGETINFGSTSSSSGGTLDVDANANCGDSDETPVENVFWATGTAPAGTYSIQVDLYDDCDTGSDQAFQLTTVVDGNSTTQSGSVAEGVPQTFTISR